MPSLCNFGIILIANYQLAAWLTEHLRVSSLMGSPTPSTFKGFLPSSRMLFINISTIHRQTAGMLDYLFFACFWVPYMNPNYFGVIGPGFLDQVPTLHINRPLSIHRAQGQHAEAAADALRPLQVQETTPPPRTTYRLQDWRSSLRPAPVPPT